MRQRTKLILLICALFIFIVGRNVQENQERGREEHRRHCLDNFCEGDHPPQNYNHATEFPFKVNGQWFIGPQEYGGYGGSFAFFWPSKTPVKSERWKRDAPEFIPSAPGRLSNFYDVAIEIFLRSDPIPPEPRGYKLITLAQDKGWIANRTQLRPGIESIQMNHVIGPHGY